MPTDPPVVRIEQFDPARHDRAGFDCGVDRLNNYLKLGARRQQRDDMSRVHVVVEDGWEAFERRKEWCESFGFTTFASDRARMFMVMKQVRAVVRARRRESDQSS